MRLNYTKIIRLLQKMEETIQVAENMRVEPVEAKRMMMEIFRNPRTYKNNIIWFENQKPVGK